MRDQDIERVDLDMELLYGQDNIDDYRPEGQAEEVQHRPGFHQTETRPFFKLKAERNREGQKPPAIDTKAFKRQSVQEQL